MSLGTSQAFSVGTEPPLDALRGSVQPTQGVHSGQGYLGKGNSMGQSAVRRPGRSLAWIRAEWARQLGLAGLALAVGAGLGVAVVAARNPVYIVAALAGLAVGVAMLVSTQVGFLSFVGIATLLPFGVIPIPLGGFKLTLVDVTLSTLLLVWLARLLLRRDERFRASGLEGFVALYAGLAVFSFLMGTGTSAETARLFLKMINSILLFFTVSNCVVSRRHLEQIIAAVILGGAASSALGIALYVLPAGTSTRLLTALAPLGYPSGGGVLRYIPSTDVLRAISTSIDPNIFGAMLMLAAVLALSQVLAPQPVLDRRLIVVAAGLTLVALLLSYSRSSWMGVLAAGVLMVVLRYRRVWVLLALAGAMLTLVVLPTMGDLPVFGGFFAHLQSGFEARDQAAAMRLGEYKDAFRLIGQYPWFGVGFGVAPDVDLYIGVSSIYLLLAEQMGLIGLSAYLLTVGILLSRALRVLVTEQPEPAISSLLLGTTAALVGALTAGIFDHHFVNLRFPHIVALFWLMAGLTVVGMRLSRESQEPSTGPE